MEKNKNIQKLNFKVFQKLFFKTKIKNTNDFKPFSN
jgi:hypothetical protein